MGKNDIRLSPKHGVNPSMTICLFCGKEKGIALMGKMKNDQQAPQRVIVDYEPCDECKKNWEQGIPLLEVTRVPQAENQPLISKDADGNPVYPTGAYLVLNEGLVDGKVGVPTLCMTEDFQKIYADILRAKENLNGQSNK